MRFRWLAVLTAVILIGADEPNSDAVKQELKKLEGTWKTVSVIQNGTKVPEDKARALIFVLKADGAWIMKDGQDSWRGTFTVEPSKKPKTGNFAILSGKYKGLTTLDIYKLDGDRLTFCYVIVPTGKESTKDRPSTFASERGTGHVLVVTQREKAN
jgi:uncharacterized protein (TIGR03067 family)